MAGPPQQVATSMFVPLNFTLASALELKSSFTQAVSSGIAISITNE
jgi:hypothetical protein